MSYIRLFFMSLAAKSILCDDCFFYDFESNFEYLFAKNGSLCQLLPSKWNIGNYADISLQPPHYRSEKFIKPSDTVSCISSQTFAAESSGVIEVKVYMESSLATDQITVLVNQVVPGGNDAVVATQQLFSMNQDFENGWHLLKMPLGGVGSYDAFISFLGSSAEGSIVLIDSFRYLSPTATDGQCIFYEEDLEPTTTEPTTTSRPVDQGCLTFDFEDDFSGLFTSNNDLCTGFPSWHLANYSTIGMDSADPKTDVFIAPNEYSSCIASFPFAMTPNGVIQVNIYIEPKSALDHIIVLAKKLVSSGTDTVAGFKIYEPSVNSFTTGWSVLEIPVIDFWTFNGYLVFLGAASEGSTVLVDSFRYIPPNYSPDNESCAIY
ncbi:hypothetical protein K1T71_009166 [Dendrolimus kikuchii]|uniref:Uncharacterized protein n=1 Tax=Dendrolimus kikuchii TaxID=765133 RepID=A0ACC1CUA6_9NEOP|nr:hypothetical protein K1T71_009166 [Dendrolimus kikuchii]